MSNLQEPGPVVQDGVTLGSVLLWPCHLSKGNTSAAQAGAGTLKHQLRASTIARIECTGAAQCLVMGGEFLKALALLHT